MTRIAFLILFVLSNISLSGQASESLKYGILRDKRDGNTYKTIKVGNQTWMAENLNFASDSSRYIDDIIEKSKTYGRFYTIDAAHNVCPDGWHLPTINDWQVLIDMMGGKSVAGGKLKASDHWKKPNVGTTDFIGFSALPAGYYDVKMNQYFQLTVDATWWTSSTNEQGQPLYVTIYNDDPEIIIITPYKEYEFTVRCLKDLPIR